MPRRGEYSVRLGFGGVCRNCVGSLHLPLGDGRSLPFPLLADGGGVGRKLCQHDLQPLKGAANCGEATADSYQCDDKDNRRENHHEFHTIASPFLPGA
jgi:hypothetical protein